MVKITVAEVGPQVYMVCWKEATGSTATHVEDHEKGILFSNATLPDGTLKHKLYTAKWKQRIFYQTIF